MTFVENIAVLWPLLLILAVWGVAMTALANAHYHRQAQTMDEIERTIKELRERLKEMTNGYHREN